MVLRSAPRWTTDSWAGIEHSRGSKTVPAEPSRKQCQPTPLAVVLSCFWGECGSNMCPKDPSTLPHR